MRTQWLAPFVLLISGATLALLVQTSGHSAAHGQTLTPATRYVPVPATVTLVPGERVTFVFPHPTFPPVEPESGSGPRQLQVISIAGQPATVADDGATLTITAAPGYLVVTDQPCISYALPLNAVQCAHDALAPQGDVGVTFTTADRSAAAPPPQHALLHSGGQITFVAANTITAIAFRHPALPFEPTTTIDVTWDGGQVTLAVAPPLQVFVPGQQLDCTPKTGPASLLNCHLGNSTGRIITVYANDPTVPGHPFGPAPTPGPRLAVTVDPTAVGVVDQPVTLRAEASVDRGGAVEDFIWDFGDGTLGTGASLEHTYAVPGIYVATALVAASNAAAVGARTVVYVVSAGLTPAALTDLHQLGTVTLPAASVRAFAPPSPSPPAAATAVPEQFLRVQIGNLSPQTAQVTDDGQRLTIQVAAGNVIRLVPPVAAHWGCSYSTPNVVQCPVGPAGLHILGFDVVPYVGETPSTSVRYAAGWNLVAGPLGTSLLTVVPPPETSTTWIYTWPAGSTTYAALPIMSPFRAGQSYWAYFAKPVTVPLNLAGPESAVVQLPAGQYALMGNPGNTPVTVSGADVVYGYDPGAGSYQETTMLQPGQGAWAYSAAGADVALTPIGLPTEAQFGEQQAPTVRPPARAYTPGSHSPTGQG